MAETCPAFCAQSILILNHSPHVQEHGIFFGTYSDNAQTFFDKIGDGHRSLCRTPKRRSWRRDEITTHRANRKTPFGIAGRRLYVKEQANTMGRVIDELAYPHMPKHAGAAHGHNNAKRLNAQIRTLISCE